ncbi:MAG: hypothetical protein LBB61_06930 [Treponema sp.]|nr:hypothetical protein [Treponema sp.]
MIGTAGFSAASEDNHDTGKKHTLDIEGNNCRLRRRIRRVFRRTACFSKSCSSTPKPLIWLPLWCIILCGSLPERIRHPLNRFYLRVNAFNHNPFPLKSFSIHLPL